MLDKMIAAKQVDEVHRDEIRDALLRKHVHQYEHARSGAKESSAANASGGGSGFLSTVRSFADIGRNFSHAKNLQHQDSLAGAQSAPADVDPQRKLQLFCSGTFFVYVSPPPTLLLSPLFFSPTVTLTNFFGSLTYPCFRSESIQTTVGWCRCQWSITTITQSSLLAQRHDQGR